MNVFTVSTPVLHRYLRDLVRHPAGPIRVPIGMSRYAEHLELLGAVPGSEIGQVLLLAWTETFAVPNVLPPDCAGILLLGNGWQRGRACGAVCLRPRQLAPLHLLRLVGPGMPVISLHQQPLPEPTGSVVEDPREAPMARWSRTIGALGKEAWQRLVGLRYGIIGVGRTGSMLALALARLGVSHLTLIDADHLELHNLGEMSGVCDADLGRPKVSAVADTIAALVPVPPRLVTVPQSITRLQALHAAQACDVLVSCVDHDSARLAATAIATVFCKPLLDVATGVHGSGAERQMGTDVRLVLPGHCLLCCGGLRDTAIARQLLISADAERVFSAQRDWQRERTGSLASLNHCAVGVALRLLEDFMAAHVQGSMWGHLEFDAAGHLTVSYPAIPPLNDRPSCHLCRLTGWGEEGVPRLVELLRHIQG